MKFKKNDKGFSLVELIIVIAIMVALVAVLAPQFTKYVEKSREAVDNDTVEQFVSSVKVAVADDDNDITLPTGTATYSIEITSSGAEIKAQDTSKKLESALAELCGCSFSSSKAASIALKQTTDGAKATITINKDGNVSVVKSWD